MGNIDIRQNTLLAILYERQGEYLKAEDLSKQVGKSLKTIRNDIAYLKMIGNKNGFLIESRTNQGYMLSVIDESLLEKYLNENGTPFYSKVAYLSEKSISYQIAFFLCLQSQAVSIEDLEEKLNYSVSVIRKNIAILKQSLANHGLILENSKNEISIQGEEYLKRMYLAFILVGVRCEVARDFFPEKKNKELLSELSSELKGKAFSISTRSRKILVQYLQLLVFRTMTGFKDKNDIDVKKLEMNYPQQVECCKNILDKLSKGNHLNFTKEEQAIFTVIFIVNSYPKQCNTVIDADQTERIDFLLKTCSEILNDKSIIDYQWLRNQLAYFTYSEQYRNEYLIRDFSFNPTKMKINRANFVELAYEVYKRYAERFGVEVCEREVIFLAECLGNVFAYSDTNKIDMTVGVISKCGIFESRRIAEMLRLNLLDFHGKFIACDKEDITSGAELLISDDKKLTTDKPVFYIEEYPRYYDVKNIETFLRKDKNSFNSKNSNISKKLFECCFNSKEQALEYIDELFRKENGTKKTVLKQLIDRDKVVSYEAVNKIALICIRDDEVKDNKICFIHLGKSILWFLNEVQFIVVVMLDKKPQQFKYLSGSLSTILSDWGFVNEFIKDPSIELINKKYI